MLRVVQIQNGKSRRVAVVDEPSLRLVDGFDSIYGYCQTAMATGRPMSEMIRHGVGKDRLDYDAVYSGQSEWRLMVPLDYPDGPAGTLVSGTGLTHFGSARDRQAMHTKTSADDDEHLTDSMKMFRWGVQGGRPALGEIGVAPEWFYKGDGAILRAHGEALEVPAYADDGGEEAEIAGLYVIGSKVRTCALGPELVIDPKFDSVAGEARIERHQEGGEVGVVWSKPIRTGEAEMCHSLRNIEHHHFKFATHRRPGEVHVHYYGAHSLSFGEGVRLIDGDVMMIRWDGFGRALRNPVHVAGKKQSPVVATPMT